MPCFPSKLTRNELSMPRLTRRATHPLVESNRTTQRNIGALADTFSSTICLHKSSPKEYYPRNISSLAEIRVCHNRKIRSASTETQCSRSESVAEEDTPWNDQNLHLRTDTGSLNSKGYRQVEEPICACHNLSPLLPDYCYSLRRYLMEQDEVLLFESNGCITNETEARLSIPVDGDDPPYRRHTVSCEGDLLPDSYESSRKNQL